MRKSVNTKYAQITPKNNKTDSCGRLQPASIDQNFNQIKKGKIIHSSISALSFSHLPFFHEVHALNRRKDPPLYMAIHVNAYVFVALNRLFALFTRIR
ncbi:MAG: hypothetical protein D3903_18445 [Candidatus Electrothrix sp. GM3_4]|nr:hypothetical protein [Candidatus Electrothrix sp. GM3_4]